MRGWTLPRHWRKPRRWAMPRPTRPSTSKASTRRTSSRCWRPTPSACRVNFADVQVRRHHHPAAAGRGLRRTAGLPHQAAGPWRGGAKSGIELRVQPALLPATHLMAQVERLDERHPGARRRIGRDDVLRRRSGRRADGLGRDRRPGGRGPARWHARRAARAAPGLPGPCPAPPAGAAARGRVHAAPPARARALAISDMASGGPHFWLRQGRAGGAPGMDGRPGPDATAHQVLVQTAEKRPRVLSTSPCMCCRPWPEVAGPCVQWRVELLEG